METKLYGYVDYLLAALLIIAPWLFDFAKGGAETWIPVVFGIIAIVYSLIIHHELGLFSKRSIQTRSALNFIQGILLTVSAWVFGLDNWTPHMLLGFIQAGLASITKTDADEEKVSFAIQ